MTARSPSQALAIAAFVLGIVSIVFSMFVVGAVFGLIGLVLGVVHMRRHRALPRSGLGGSAIVLSGVGLVASVGFGTLYFFLFSTIIRSAFSPNQEALMAWVGTEAPSFTVTTLDGQVLELEKLEGRRVVIDMWATWCGPCIREVPDFNRLTQEHSADDVLVIGISKEPHDIIEPFVAKHGVEFPIVSADELPEPYSLVRAIPTKFFIDRNGVIQSIVLGARGFESLQEHALAADYAGEVRSAPLVPAAEGEPALSEI